MAEQTPSDWRPPPVWTPPAHFPEPSEPIRYSGNAAGPAIFVAAALVLLAGGVGVMILLGANATSTVVTTTPQGVSTAVAKPKSPGEAWDGRSTISCGMGEELVLENKQATVDGTVVRTSLNCRLVIKNCKLKGDTVIDAAMTSHVKIENSTIEATSVGIDVAQAADVSIEKNSRVISKDTGVRLGQVGKLRLSDSTIEADGTAIDGAMACQITAERSRIAGKTTSLHAASGCDVTLTNTKLEGKKRIASDVQVSEK